MAGQELTNPNDAFGSNVASRQEDQNFRIVTEFPQTGAVAIAANDAVALVWDGSAKTIKVEALDTDASGQSASIGVGVALDAAAASSGKSVRVVVFGYAKVNVASGTAAEGSLAIGSTTKGIAGVVAADATTVVGTAIGVYLGAKDADNKAPVWVGKL